MTDADLIAQVRALPQGAVYITALTLYGEGRGVGGMELAGLASTIANRVKAGHWGSTADAVCLARHQFSCWSPAGGRHDYETVIDAARALIRPQPIVGPVLRRCLDLAREVVDGSLVDSVAGSCFYLTTALFAQAPPRWAQGQIPAVIIGHTAFFNTIT